MDVCSIASSLLRSFALLRGTRRNTPLTKTMLVLILLLNLACMLSCQSTTDGAPDSESATSSEDKSGAVSLTSEFGKSSQAPPGGNLCRDRSGLFLQDAFKKWTCGMCFSYLYNGQVKTVAFHTRAHVMVVLNATGQPVSVLTPHVDDPAVVEAVCAEVEEAGEDCSRWTQCCRAAEACCERQLASETPSGTRTHDTDGGSSGAGAGGYCPRTWDGYSCWDDTESGSNARKMCPSYIEHSSQDATAIKQCTENGSWYISPQSQQEWTDYTGCVALD